MDKSKILAVLREVADRFPDVERVSYDDRETWDDIVESCAAAANAVKSEPDTDTVEVRILVRVDGRGHYGAAGFGQPEHAAREDLHEQTNCLMDGDWVDGALYSMVTARVPKPVTAEVEGTVVS